MQEKHWPFNWLGLLSFNNCNVLLLLHVKNMVNVNKRLVLVKLQKRKKKKKKTPSDTYKAVNKTKKLSEKFQKNCC